MTEFETILNTHSFQSKKTLKEQLSSLGVKSGDHLIVHASLKSMGWIAGGEQAVVEALMEFGDAKRHNHHACTVRRQFGTVLLDASPCSRRVA